MSHVVNVCILNQSKGHWLLNDALNIAISMSLKLKEEMNHLPLLDAWIDDDDFDLNIVLETFTKNIEKVIKIIGSFLSLLTRYNERRAHNMLALMLDPRLKV